MSKRERKQAVSLQLLTKKQLAEILQCSERTIDRYIYSGKIPKPLRIGTRKRWRLSEIENWMQSNNPNLIESSR